MPDSNPVNIDLHTRVLAGKLVVQELFPDSTHVGGQSAVLRMSPELSEMGGAKCLSLLL